MGEFIATRIEWRQGAKNVELATSANNWIPCRMHHSVLGYFYVDVDLSPGLNQYKFIVDGQWVHSASVDTIDDGYGGKNNIIWVERCPICLGVIRRAYQLSCNHNFCRSCLISYLNDQLDERVYEIKCPIGRCNHIIPHEQLIEFLLSSSRVKQLQRNIVRQTVLASSHLCFCPRCEAVCTKEAESPVFCSECQCNFCVHCHLDWNERHTCDDDIAYMDNFNIPLKHCPFCSAVSFKDEGCDCVKCPICRYRYCWNCLTLCKDINDPDAHGRTCSYFNSFRDEDSDDPAE